MMIQIVLLEVKKVCAVNKVCVLCDIRGRGSIRKSGRRAPHNPKAHRPLADFALSNASLN